MGNDLESEFNKFDSFSEGEDYSEEEKVAIKECRSSIL